MLKGQVVATNNNLPSHISVIMDGNGRWAQRRGLPRIAGHRKGIDALQGVVKYSSMAGVKYLTVYAFSSENCWRPEEEISMLTELFEAGLLKYSKKIDSYNTKLRFIGDQSFFSPGLRQSMEEASRLTANNTGLQLIIALNYGGRWDITNAFIELAKAVKDGRVDIKDIDEKLVGKFMCLSDLPMPDLLIRTGGEKRISNYLLWQLAYTELYFDDCLWPDFNVARLQDILKWYAGRERRFGTIGKSINYA